MSRKHILTISLLLPLMAASAVADAGTIISDKRYWPDVARSSAPADSRARSFTAPAASMNWIAPPAQPVTVTPDGSPLGRYQGGPKGR